MAKGYILTSSYDGCYTLHRPLWVAYVLDMEFWIWTERRRKTEKILGYGRDGGLSVMPLYATTFPFI